MMCSIKWADGGLHFIIHSDILEMKVTKIIDSSLAEDVKEKAWRREAQGLAFAKCQDRL